MRLQGSRHSEENGQRKHTNDTDVDMLQERIVTNQARLELHFNGRREPIRQIIREGGANSAQCPLCRNDFTYLHQLPVAEKLLNRLQGDQDRTTPPLLPSYTLRSPLSSSPCCSIMALGTLSTYQRTNAPIRFHPLQWHLLNQPLVIRHVQTKQ